MAYAVDRHRAGRHTVAPVRPRVVILPILLALLLLPASALGAGPRIVDLGAAFHPVAVNSESVVAGDLQASLRAARWKDGVLSTLAPLTMPAAYEESSATDINEDGDVVGRSFRDAFPAPSQIRATVWPGGGGASGIAPAVTNANVPMSEGEAINDAGVVAGGSAFCRANMSCGFPQAARGSGGGSFSLLPPEPGASQSSDATDINNGGVVVGTSAGAGAIWTGTSHASLGTFFPAAINDAGTIAGRIGSTPYQRSAAGVLTSIPAAGNANDINAAGDIVGSQTAPFDGWVLHQGTVYDLDSLLPEGTTGWDILSATGISDTGEIVGRAEHNGTQVGYLLTPDYPGFRVFGSVTSTDGQGIPGVAMRVTGPHEVTVVTDQAGEYSIDLEAGTYTIASLDDAVRPKAPQLGCGATACTFTIDTADVRRDFEKGCARSLTMGASFAAINGCFVKKSETEYETTEPFRVNGLDVTPGGKVSFNTLSASMTGGPLTLRIGDDGILQDQSVDWSFAAGTITFTPPSVRVRGVPLSGSVSVATTAGSSTLTLTGEIPKDLRASFNPFTGWEASQPDLDGSFSATVTATTTNDDGLRSLGLAASPADVIKLPFRPGAADDPAKPKNALTVRELRGSFDFVTHNWTLGAKVSAPFGKSEAIEVDATLMFNGHFLPVRITVNANGINRPIPPPGIFLQRLAFDFGLTGLGATDPFTWTAGVGISLGPQMTPRYVNLGVTTLAVIPTEYASLDGTVTLADVDRNPLTLEDTTYAGDGIMRIFDQPIASGGFTWFIGLGSVEFRGRVQYEDPTGGIVVSGSAKGWWDGAAAEAFLSGKGTVHIHDLIENDIDYVVSKRGIAACAGDRSGTYGISYEFATGREHIGGCDLGAFSVRPLAPRVRASAAGPKTFRLGARQGVTALAVKGARFKVKGPGVNVTRSGDRAFKRGRVRVIPIGAEKTTYVILLSPKAGRYAVTGASSVRFASRLPDPKVTATLSGDGCRPALRWRARRIAGQQVRIVDGAATGHAILTSSKKASGKVMARPAGEAVRTLEAQVLQGDGVRATIRLARYAPVAGAKPIATGNLRRARRGIAWDPVCGATAYRVKVGRARAKRTRKPALTTRVPKGARVVVTAIGRGGAKGPAASAKLR
jgi:hypothetical protein